MSVKKPNELIDRYEEMLRGTVSCYFDTDEIDEISDYYESKGQLSKALHAIKFGLNLHPDNVDLKLKEARYMLYLDRADEAKRIMSELADYSLDATLIRAELLFIDGYMKDGHALLLAMLDNDDIREDFCFDAVDIPITIVSMNWWSSWRKRERCYPIAGSCFEKWLLSAKSVRSMSDLSLFIIN